MKASGGTGTYSWLNSVRNGHSGNSRSIDIAARKC
jgi:hypothetical protein